MVDQRAVQPAHVDPVQILDDRRDRNVRQVPPARSGAHSRRVRSGRQTRLFTRWLNLVLFDARGKAEEIFRKYRRP